MAATMYLHRFHQRNRLSIRRITHHSTKKRIEMEKIADEFSKTIQYSLEKSSEVSHIVGSAMFASVFNMDQSAVYIDMNPNTTIDFVGAKHIDVVQGKTFLSFAFLCSSAIGEKLQPMIIFAGSSFLPLRRTSNKIRCISTKLF
ncbi:hypothetical protein L915_00257 [Phytophthora nicotianae]|uniref:Uncharacterized protein n=1 Tax=Phytophthora nicotianae TaxID=4792 RepID=W2HPG3_PHYNI|nr:hypothetical protein L915_00257 [Phytophthora nicotianae]